MHRSARAVTEGSRGDAEEGEQAPQEVEDINKTAEGVMKKKDGGERAAKVDW